MDHQHMEAEGMAVEVDTEAVTVTLQDLAANLPGGDLGYHRSSQSTTNAAYCSHGCWGQFRLFNFVTSVLRCLQIFQHSSFSSTGFDFDYSAVLYGDESVVPRTKILALLT